MANLFSGNNQREYSIYFQNHLHPKMNLKNYLKQKELFEDLTFKKASSYWRGTGDLNISIDNDCLHY